MKKSLHLKASDVMAIVLVAIIIVGVLLVAVGHPQAGKIVIMTGGLLVLLLGWFIASAITLGLIWITRLVRHLHNAPRRSYSRWWFAIRVVFGPITLLIGAPWLLIWLLVRLNRADRLNTT